MINTVSGSKVKPVSSQQLAEILSSEEYLEGILYIGYPIIGTPDGSFPIDALLVSPQKGLVLFNLIEGRKASELSKYGDKQDEAFNKMQAKLLQHQALIRKRKLRVNIHTVTFAPVVANLETHKEKGYPLCNSHNLTAAIDDLDKQDDDIFTQLVSVIQAISTLRRGRRRRDPNDLNSKGTKIKDLEDSIANLDMKQSAAVIETFEGVQRIRGLAGSGKTIVLALKVAYLHARHPNWDIAVTFHTRSLKNQFKNLITTFVFEQANAEPDWEKVRILNAWGAPGGENRAGIYFEFCRDHGVEYLDYRNAKMRFSDNKEFEGACRVALESARKFAPKYDAILVDEAQDFAPNFLLLCYELLKDPKRLIYAYDELQNLGMRSLPPMEDIFGKNSDGSPRVILHPKEPGKPKQDIVLDICYRNSRPVLTTAHALGFGIYRAEGLIQIFENNRLWLDVGYEVSDGEFADGKKVTLKRASKSSPDFLENHSTINDLISFEVFDSEEKQTAYVVDNIIKNLTKDELFPDDIIVINPDPLKTKKAVGVARKTLMEKNINSNLAGITNSADSFSEPGNVTFTGIFRAKGNEAAMVYIINAQDCFSAFVPRGLARVRNQLFTAITRSKAWVRVIGVGPNMVALKEEFEKVKASKFKLSFDYPTAEQRKEITIVNRDMSKDENERLNQKQHTLIDLLESLESRETFIEDYPDDVVKRFRTLLNRRRK